MTTTVPVPEPAQVLIKVLAFGMNRAGTVYYSVLPAFPAQKSHSRNAQAAGTLSNVQVPCIIGTEVVGRIVADAAGDDATIPVDSLVATCMGGLGAKFLDHIGLDPATVAAPPEMLQTTYESLAQALDLQSGDSLLIAALRASMNWQLSSWPTQFDKCLELTGTKTSKDSILCVKLRRTVCMTGIQGGERTAADFSPITELPPRRRLLSYGGDEHDFISMPWETLVAAVEDGKITIPVHRFQ
ncbi:hypothetical protein LLEC1_00986 [Akanthomyces lecanii]|uniref:Uncharacterized protein n=1 Tax=Cordyceps confragosa TaxID=2714763 RepID=A0A179I4H9_CORDF|nr:hypothetical protein LLEC1_00986 [Akanthomyces lecanii]